MQLIYSSLSTVMQNETDHKRILIEREARISFRKVTTEMPWDVVWLLSKIEDVHRAEEVGKNKLGPLILLRQADRYRDKDRGKDRDR